MLSDLKKKEIVAYIHRKIEAVMDWYIYGDAVDCKETRQNINKDLDSILPEVESKFRLKKIPLQLRVRSIVGEPGIFKVRLEKLDLC